MPPIHASAGVSELRCSGATVWLNVCFRRTVTSPTELHEPFTRRSDREGDDKVPEVREHDGPRSPRFAPDSRETPPTSMPFASLTRLKTNLRERMDKSARGTDVPAGIERGSDVASPTGSRERGRMRRRLRELRRLREAQLLELGALVLEAHRHGRDDSPVINSKAAEAAATDAETRALAEALETDAGLESIVSAGIAGPCPTCGTLASTGWRFCSTCGTPLDGRPDAAPPGDQHDAPETPLADAREADTAPAAKPATTELPAANGHPAAAEEMEAPTPHET